MLVQGDNLVETITFSLFSDLCLGTEEALLLSMVSVGSRLCVCVGLESNSRASFFCDVCVAYHELGVPTV
jgi:hypothetical protein